MRHSLIVLAAAFAGGILLRTEGLCPVPFGLCVPLAAGVAIASALGAMVYRPALAGLLVSVALIGVHRCDTTLLPFERLYRLVPSMTEVTGTVVSYPELTSDRAFFLLRPEGMPGRIRVTSYGSPSERCPIRCGDRVRLRGRFSVPSSGLAFDYRRHLARQGVFALLAVRSGDERPEVLGTEGPAILRAGDLLRQGLLTRLQGVLPPSTWGLAQGLLFGETHGIADDVEAAFRETGLYHLLAVSGMHLTVLLAGVWVVLRRFGIRPVVGYPLASAAVVALLWIVGWPVSLLRAALLFGVLGLGAVLADLGVLSRRSLRPGCGLAGAALVLLAVWPPALFDLGFQLSFAATGAILSLLVLPRGRRDRHPALVWRAGAWLKELGLVSLAAQAGTSPLTAARLGLVYPLGLVANLVAVPLSSLAMWAGVGALLLAWSPVLPVLGAVFGFLLCALAAVARAMATLPGASLPAPSWLGVWLLGLFLLGLGVDLVTSPGTADGPSWGGPWTGTSGRPGRREGG